MDKTRAARSHASRKQGKSRKHERTKTRIEGNLQHLIFRDLKLFIPDCLVVSVGDRSEEEVIGDDGKVVGKD